MGSPAPDDALWGVSRWDMARRDFFSVMHRIAREGAKASDRARRQQLREQQAYARQLERQKIADEKERQRRYLEDRQSEARSMNEDLENQVASLEGLLIAGMDGRVSVDFESMLEVPVSIEKAYGGLNEPLKAPDPKKFLVWKPFWFLMLIPFIRDWYARRVGLARDALNAAEDEYRRREAERVERLQAVEEDIQQKQDAENKRVQQKNQEVLDWKEGCAEGDPNALASYFTLLLSNSAYPDGFPKKAKVAYSISSKQLLVNYFMPEIGKVIPFVRQYKYVKSTDEITSSAQPEKQRRAWYSSVVAQVAIRSIHEIFRSEYAKHVDTIVFNGYVEALDPATGRMVSPCLLSVRTTRPRFDELDLRYVDPVACLQQLQAAFSRSPAELSPVRPILELNMQDPRFVTEMDVISGLDKRPNLMDLTPGEFESLITNLFEKMGLSTRLTQASRDGGVDCVAFDPRPIFGGKVVIQAKRYKNTVGVSAVRDLFGTLQNEGASKGILVTTSGYGKAAFDFANGKPIELLDGAHLLYLLKEHAGIEAKIIMPDFSDY